MITYVPRNDLFAFVESFAKSSSLEDVLERLQREIHDTECNFSRDARTRFEQMRYLNSLRRVLGLLHNSVVPADLTPRERLAICGLRQCITKQVPVELAFAFKQVTLPAGMFGQNFEVRHRLAS